MAQKDQALREKDKQVYTKKTALLCNDDIVCALCWQICQLKAEMLDKEKEIRTKLQAQQKSYNETVENLQVNSPLPLLLSPWLLIVTLGGD